MLAGAVFAVGIAWHGQAARTSAIAGVEAAELAARRDVLARQPGVLAAEHAARDRARTDEAAAVADLQVALASLQVRGDAAGQAGVDVAAAKAQLEQLQGLLGSAQSQVERDVAVLDALRACVVGSQRALGLFAAGATDAARAEIQVADGSCRQAADVLAAGAGSQP